jgi:hypothetical protein
MTSWKSSSRSPPPLGGRDSEESDIFGSFGNCFKMFVQQQFVFWFNRVLGVQNLGEVEGNPYMNVCRCSRKALNILE